MSDVATTALIERVLRHNYSVYGARKVTLSCIAKAIQSPGARSNG